MNHIDCLPSEMKALIFSSLNKEDLGHCCSVSSQWNKQANENALWRKFAQAMFKGEIPREMNAKELLQRCEAQKLRSNDEILETVQNFANRIHLGQTGRFRCFLTQDGGEPLTIQIKGSLSPIFYPSPSINHFDVQEDYFALHAIGKGKVKTIPVFNTPHGQSEQWSGGRGRYRTKRPANGPFFGDFDVPCESYVFRPLNDQNPLEKGITNILRTKLDSFRTEQFENSVLFKVAVAIDLVVNCVFLLIRSLFCIALLLVPKTIEHALLGDRTIKPFPFPHIKPMQNFFILFY